MNVDEIFQPKLSSPKRARVFSFQKSETEDDLDNFIDHKLATEPQKKDDSQMEAGDPALLRTTNVFYAGKKTPTQHLITSR